LSSFSTSASQAGEWWALTSTPIDAIPDLSDNQADHAASENSTELSMSFTYQIDPQAGIIEIRGAGVITHGEYIAGLMSWMTDPLFSPGLDGLCDFTAAESTPTMADLRELIDLVARHTAYVGRVKVAMIVSKPIMFAVARQFASLAEAAQLEVQLFRDRDSAMSWLRPAGQTLPLCVTKLPATY
jgi:hypothetical protein